MRSNYFIEELINLSESAIIEKVKKSDVLLKKDGQKRSIDKLSDDTDVSNVHSYNISRFDELDEVFNDILELIDGIQEERAFTITLDISLLSRKVVAEIMSFVAKQSKQHDIELCIVYELVKYKAPSRSNYSNNAVKPVNRFYNGWSHKPGLPVLTIVGLGYEEDKALGAIEYVESSSSLIFLPNSIEEKYREDVDKVNHNILSVTSKQNKIEYDVGNPVQAIFSIESLINANKSKYKIVLFPFGPKIHFACSLIAAIAHPETSVWYVSGEDNDKNSSQDRDVAALIGFSCKIKGKR